MKKNKKDEEVSDQAFLSDEIEDIFTRSDGTPPAEGEGSGGLLPDDELTDQVAAGKKRLAGRRSESTIAKSLLFALPLSLVLLFALFVWPTLYEYSSSKQDTRIYLVKTNRLTDTKSFFYGGKWLDKPLPGPAPLRLPDPLSITSPGDQPPPPLEKPVDKAPAPVTAKPPAETKAVTQVPATVPEKKIPQPKPAPAKVEKNPVAPAAADLKKETTPPAAVEESEKPVAKTKHKAKPAAAKPYAIQIGAFPTKDEMTIFLEDQGNRTGTYWVKVRVGNQLWYRVFIGHFTDQDEARAWMKKKKIDKRYPGCFVQKKS